MYRIEDIEYARGVLRKLYGSGKFSDEKIDELLSILSSKNLASINYALDIKSDLAVILNQVLRMRR